MYIENFLYSRLANTNFILKVANLLACEEAVVFGKEFPRNKIATAMPLASARVPAMPAGLSTENL